MNPPSSSNADFCGKVPLHQTNSIQPHGALLVVDGQTHRILQASENATAVFNRPVKELVTHALLQLISVASAEALQKCLQANTDGGLPVTLQTEAGTYLAVVRRQDDFYFLEIEGTNRGEAAHQSFVAVHQNLKYVMAEMEAAATTDDVCQIVVSELKRLSGFDKVMVYRFDESWNGDVIAEAAEEGMDRYLGLRFPASDIPKQARDLYKKTPYRLIPNVRYEAVKLYPVLNPLTQAFTNLSDCSLRSVAAVHLEYLRNMNVAASMSTRIVKDGELWGLIACHHRTANYLSYEMCSVFELLSTVIATKIGAVQAADATAYGAVKQKQFRDFLQAWYRNDDTASSLRHLLEADGIAVLKDGRLQTEGSVPPANELENLADWLRYRDGGSVLVHEPNLSAVYEPAAAYAQEASGLLALTANGGESIFAFRREAVETVRWGGNPAEAVRFESDGRKYHPRASFQQWQQTVKSTALPWSSQVLRMAAEVAEIISAHRSAV